jgi:DNA primase
MFFGQEVLHQVRSANDIVDVIEWLNVPLKKQGASLKALCPFHKEKTPSFIVNRQRQSFTCFGCGVGGDVFKFIMLREGLDFMSAVRRLADRARISLPETDQRRGQAGPSRDEKEELYQLHDRVKLWYHQNLMRSRQAEAARLYLKKRGFGAITAKEFMLGYAPDAWDGLISWAAGEKVPAALLEKAGLVVPGQRGPYDRFRDRLMIPIADENGRTVGFSGRLLSNDAKEAKYVNSPETAIFKKGRLFFGLNRSKRELQQSKTALVCEGQLDAIRCMESGILNVVAPQGTAFTEDHARILKRYVESVVLCFDSDQAGQTATWKNAEKLLVEGLNVRAVRLPPGEDPDSLIRKDGGAQLKQLISEAVDVFEYKAISMSRTLDMKDPKSHQKAAAELIPMLHLIESETWKHRLAQNVTEILGMDTEAFLIELNRHERKLARQSMRSHDRESLPMNTPVDSSSIHGLCDHLLQVSLANPLVAKLLSGQLEESWFEDYPLKRVLLHVLCQARDQKWKPGWDCVELQLEDSEQERLARLLTDAPEMSEKDLAQFLQLALSGVRRVYYGRREVELLKVLKGTGLSESQSTEIKRELLDLARKMKQT